jgi:hypothetical protein
MAPSGRSREDLALESGAQDPADADELAILRALEVAARRGARRVRVRSSNNPIRRILRDELRATGGEEEAPGSLRARILALAGTFEEVKLSFQLRRRNDGPRRLARAALHP